MKLFLWTSTIYLKFLNKSEVISFPSAFRSAKTVLILLPTQEKDLIVACRTLEKYQRILSPRRIFIFVHVSQLAHIPDIWKEWLITYDDKCITPWFTPRRSLRLKIWDIESDIVINLNPEFDLFFANVSIKSKAQLRISLFDKNGESFFNLQINDSRHQFLDQRYTSMLKYIDLIAGYSTYSHQSGIFFTSL